MNSPTWQKRKAYLATGGVGLFLAAGYLGLALQLPHGRLDQPGAGVFPIVAGVILIVASLTTIWEGWQLDRGAYLALPGGADRRRVLQLVALLLGFIVALPWLGQAISSVLFCILLMRLLSDLGWSRIVACSLAICGALYGVFVVLLKVPMPRGILDF